MCGLAGIINKAGFSSGLISEMTDIIKHRGPDDEGFVIWTNDDDRPEVLFGKNTPNEIFKKWPAYKIKNVNSVENKKAVIAFGHRRLSILDLSATGHQPMAYLNNRYWIIFNGEIYNYLELREELKAKGYEFKSNSDTEVILASFDHWGVDCQNRFNGMWAFSIYDTATKNIFLSRDRFGIKPLYYWFSPDGSFCFGSEIKQFTIHKNWKTILNKNRAFDFLYFSLTDHTEETMFKDVFMLTPGGCFFDSIEKLSSYIKAGKLPVKQWYNPKKKLFEGGFEEAKKGFLKRFQEAIKLHIRADVPIGSALSGGLDSSSIVSYINILLRKQDKSDLQKTFSSVSNDEKYSEKKWIDEVVKETQVEGHFIYPNGKDVFTLTEKLIWHMDEPYQSQSAFLGYHVFQEAKKNKVIVLLNGQGADEYLSGYTAFRSQRQKELIKQLKIKSLKKENIGFSGILKILLRIAYEKIPLKLRFSVSQISLKNRQLYKIIDQKHLVRKRLHPYLINGYKKTDHYVISNYQLFTNPLPRYLRWEDRNSMAHSVEARVPFLDYRLVEFVRNLPLDFLDAPFQTKRILVESMNGILPEKIRQRKDKKGFITPEQGWLSGEYQKEFLDMFDHYAPYAKEIIRHDKARSYIQKVQSGILPFDYTYWRLILFCVWMKVFNVETD